MKILLLFLLYLFCFQAVQDPAEAQIRLLGPEEFYLGIKSADLPLILDVRSWKQYKKDRIPGARLTESSAILKSLVDSCDTDQAIFVYCEDNYRSTAACSFLRDWGYENVFELAGGMIAWRLASYEIDTEKVKRPDW